MRDFYPYRDYLFIIFCLAVCKNIFQSAALPPADLFYFGKDPFKLKQRFLIDTKLPLYYNK